MFAKKQTPKQVARAAGRDIKKTKRELDREGLKELQRTEKRLLTDLKKAGATGNKERCKQIAGQIVKTRAAIAKIEKMKGNLDGIATDVQVHAAQMAAAESQKKATKVMTKINKQQNVEKVMKNAQKFQMEMAKAEINQEMIDDALETLDDEADEELEDEIVGQVLAEAGINATADLESAPMTQVGVQQEEGAMDDEERREIEAALNL